MKGVLSIIPGFAPFSQKQACFVVQAWALRFDSDNTAESHSNSRNLMTRWWRQGRLTSLKAWFCDQIQQELNPWLYKRDSGSNSRMLCFHCNSSILCLVLMSTMACLTTTAKSNPRPSVCCGICCGKQDLLLWNALFQIVQVLSHWLCKRSCGNNLCP